MHKSVKLLVTWCEERQSYNFLIVEEQCVRDHTYHKPSFCVRAVLSSLPCCFPSLFTLGFK